MVISHTWKTLIIQTVIGNSQIESFAQFKYYTHICSAKHHYDLFIPIEHRLAAQTYVGLFLCPFFCNDISVISK